MRDQQHFAIFPPTDLLDDIEMFLDLKAVDALSCQLHQLVDQAPIDQTQLNHFVLQQTTQTKQTALTPSRTINIRSVCMSRSLGPIISCSELEKKIVTKIITV